MTRHTRIALAALALALAAPLAGAQSNVSPDSGTTGGAASGDSAAAPMSQRSSHGYKYDYSLNAGGRAGGSTVPRDLREAPHTAQNSGEDYKVGQSNSVGGRAGGSTAPQ
jgi:hypothetical protein